MDPTRDNVKRPVPILTKENWRTWLTDFEYWMIGEGLDFVVTETLLEYATIQTPISSDTTSIDTPMPDQSAEEHTKGFAKFNTAIETKKESDVVFNSKRR